MAFPSAVPLTPWLLSNFKVSRTFEQDRNPAYSMCFDESGDHCAAATKHNTLDIYDCRAGTLKVSYNHKQYGVGLCRYTHLSSNMILSSAKGLKGQGEIRYFSLHDNTYLRLYRGHTTRVVCLEMSPLDDQFISSAFDGTVRLWDLRAPECHGLLDLDKQERLMCTIDNAGLVFAVALYPEIRLYDIRSFDTGPFSTWSIQDEQLPEQGARYWSSIKFTNNGKHILLTTTYNTHYLIDAFEGKIVKRLLGVEPVPFPDPTEPMGRNKRNRWSEEVALTPDGRYALGGTSRQTVVVWDLLSTPEMDTSLIREEHLRTYEMDVMASPLPNCAPLIELASPRLPDVVRPVYTTHFSPKSALFVTSDEDAVKFWQPPPSIF